MQSQASLNVFRVNHLNDISENPFRFAVGTTSTKASDVRRRRRRLFLIQVSGPPPLKKAQKARCEGACTDSKRKPMF